MFTNASMISDRPKITFHYREFENKLLSIIGNSRIKGCSAISSSASGASSGGGRICTCELRPRQEPDTRKLLKLYSRPVFIGPALIEVSISSLIRFHSSASKPGPGSMATMSLPRKVSPTRHDDPARGRKILFVDFPSYWPGCPMRASRRRRNSAEFKFAQSSRRRLATIKYYYFAGKIPGQVGSLAVRSSSPAAIL